MTIPSGTTAVTMVTVRFRLGVSPAARKRADPDRTAEIAVNGEFVMARVVDMVATPWFIAKAVSAGDDALLRNRIRPKETRVSCLRSVSPG